MIAREQAPSSCACHGKPWPDVRVCRSIAQARLDCAHTHAALNAEANVTMQSTSHVTPHTSHVTRHLHLVRLILCSHWATPSSQPLQLLQRLTHPRCASSACVRMLSTTHRLSYTALAAPPAPSPPPPINTPLPLPQLLLRRCGSLLPPSCPPPPPRDSLRNDTSTLFHTCKGAAQHRSSLPTTARVLVTSCCISVVISRCSRTMIVQG